jgi:hypothetical protein
MSFENQFHFTFLAAKLHDKNEVNFDYLNEYLYFEPFHFRNLLEILKNKLK